LVSHSCILSKDLEKKRFFENFTFSLHPVVIQECDTKGGRAEFSKLAQYSSIGRIHLRELPEDITEKKGSNDDIIVDAAKKSNSLIYTRDGAMEATATAREIFYLKS
jgi:rRNA-processing protein FCF1